jgi:hypothetical protein
MNREGVWIDSDCDGNKNSIGVGEQTTVAAQFTHLGAAKTMYLGVGGDNQFKVVVNGVIVADTGATVSNLQFKIWHIIPIDIVTGVNYINVIGTGDGSPDDSVAFVIYDNTPAEIIAATTDADLSIIAKTSTLRGDDFDVATCPATYSLDTSGGQGNYICRRTLTKVCNSAS